MTPTRPPNPALEWRLNAIDRLTEQQINKLLAQLSHLGIDPRRNQLKTLTTKMTEFLKTLDEMGDKT
jgi:hypothetical protein